MLWNFINSNKYPETAEYYEKIIPNDIEEAITYLAAQNFNFRPHTDTKGNTYPIPGLRTNRNITSIIETKVNFPFKAGDMIRFDLDERAIYTIDRIDLLIETGNNEEYIFLNQAFPGWAKDSMKYKVIYLR